MKKVILLALVGVASLFISTCENNDIIFDADATTFQGVVLDSATGMSVESVKVSPLDTIPELLITITDSVGFFEIYDPNGRRQFPLYFRKNGYQTSLSTLIAGERSTVLMQGN